MASPALNVQKQGYPAGFCQNQSFWKEVEMAVRIRSHGWQKVLFLLTSLQVQQL